MRATFSITMPSLVALKRSSASKTITKSFVICIRTRVSVTLLTGKVCEGEHEFDIRVFAPRNGYDIFGHGK